MSKENQLKFFTFVLGLGSITPRHANDCNDQESWKDDKFGCIRKCKQCEHCKKGIK